MRKSLLLAIIALLPSAQASILFYNDQATFASALDSPSYTEAFSGVSLGAVATPQSFSGNGFSFDVSATNGLVGISIGGDRSLSPNDNTDALTLSNFGGTPNAVGAYFYFDNGIGGIATGISGTITASNGVDPDLVVNITDPTSLTSFYGFISTNGPLVSIAFSRSVSGPNGWQDVDDVIVGTAATPVPEPGSAALLSAGLAAAYFFKRRSTRA